MYKIKEFSKKTALSIVTLRYYDEINLLNPSYVDRYTGYRYYEEDQVHSAIQIRRLKELGLSLEEIKQYMKTNNPIILIRKEKGYERKMKEIEQFLKEQEQKQYQVIKADYKKYVELNGLLHSRSAQALEVKDGNADYYYIMESDQIIKDFVIYKKEKWITLGASEWKKEDMIHAIREEIKKDYDQVCLIVPIEEKEMIQYIKDHYHCHTEEITQAQYSYLKLTFLC